MKPKTLKTPFVGVNLPATEIRLCASDHGLEVGLDHDLAPAVFDQLGAAGEVVVDDEGLVAGDDEYQLVRRELEEEIQDEEGDFDLLGPLVLSRCRTQKLRSGRRERRLGSRLRARAWCLSSAAKEVSSCSINSNMG